MRDLPRFRPREWDELENRVLPSGLGVVPVERFQPHAVERHAQDVEAARAGDADVVFLGDSITDNWGDEHRAGVGREVWNERIAPLGAANFGVAGDTTANLLWRIGDGELAGKPRLVVLEIGTNDLARGHSAHETVAGIHAVIDAVIDASPSSRILLMGILPRGQGYEDPLTREARAVNAEVAGLAGGRISYLDVGAKFVHADGTLDTSLFLDRLHPNERGYEIWADALVPAVASALGARLGRIPPPAEADALVPAAASAPAAPPPSASSSSTAANSTGPEAGPSSGLVLIAPPLDSDAWEPMAAMTGHAARNDRWAHS